MSGTPIPCPSCGATAAGRFCTQCGAVVREAPCSACGVALTPGSKFCHECGASVRAQVAQHVSERPASRQRRVEAQPSNNLRWILGGLAFVVLVVIFAAQRAGQAPPSAMPAGAPTGAAAVDISSMTPQERASRLFDRIMRLSEEGKRDSVELFASMAIPCTSRRPARSRCPLDLGRIAQVSAQLDWPGQDDTILQRPLTTCSVSSSRSRWPRRRASISAASLRAVSSRGNKPTFRDLPEYARHRSDIDAAWPRLVDDHDTEPQCSNDSFGHSPTRMTRSCSTRSPRDWSTPRLTYSHELQDIETLNRRD